MPFILDLQGLLIFQRFVTEGPHDRNGNHDLEVVRETGANGNRPKFVRDGCTAQNRRRDARWKGAADLEVEWKEMATGFQGVGLLVRPFEERPIMVADDVSQCSIVVDQAAKSQLNPIAVRGERTTHARALVFVPFL